MAADFRWPVRVYYEDTDAGGIVYYANYLRFAERARSELLRDMGTDNTTLLNDHIMHDATDSRGAFEAGQLQLVGQ